MTLPPATPAPAPAPATTVYYNARIGSNTFVQEVQWTRKAEEARTQRREMLANGLNVCSGEIDCAETDEADIRKQINAHLDQRLQERVNLGQKGQNLTACPKCKSMTLKISARQYVTVFAKFNTEHEHDVEDVSGGDIEWDEDDYTECAECNHSGLYVEFQMPNFAEIRPVTAQRIKALLTRSAPGSTAGDVEQLLQKANDLPDANLDPEDPGTAWASDTTLLNLLHT